MNTWLCNDIYICVNSVKYEITMAPKTALTLAPKLAIVSNNNCTKNCPNIYIWKTKTYKHET